MWQLKIYIDVFGKVGICELFPDDEEHAGLNDLLKEYVVDECMYNDLWDDKQVGFYTGCFSLIDKGTEDVCMILEAVI